MKLFLFIALTSLNLIACNRLYTISIYESERPVFDFSSLSSKDLVIEHIKVTNTNCLEEHRADKACTYWESSLPYGKSYSSVHISHPKKVIYGQALELHSQTVQAKTLSPGNYTFKAQIFLTSDSSKVFKVIQPFTIESNDLLQ